MKKSMKVRIALRMARSIGACARFLRRDLRDHIRNESLRIELAEKRARGLRLYAALAMHQLLERVPQSRLPALDPADAVPQDVELATFKH
jgi:hypothetical protein